MDYGAGFWPALNRQTMERRVPASFPCSKQDRHGRRKRRRDRFRNDFLFQNLAPFLQTKIIAVLRFILFLNLSLAGKRESEQALAPSVVFNRI
jgi:hypothetical protein